MNMTKRAIRSALGYDTDIQLAAFFGLTKGAISQWPEDEPIPELRQYKACELRPDLFGKAPRAEAA